MESQLKGEKGELFSQALTPTHSQPLTSLSTSIKTISADLHRGGTKAFSSADYK